MYAMCCPHCVHRSHRNTNIRRRTVGSPLKLVAQRSPYMEQNDKRWMPLNPTDFKPGFKSWLPDFFDKNGVDFGYVQYTKYANSMIHW